MNLYIECDDNQIELLNEAGIYVEDRDYNENEINNISNDILDYIMSQSKNSIWKVQNKYEIILNKIVIR